MLDREPMSSVKNNCVKHNRPKVDTSIPIINETAFFMSSLRAAGAAYMDPTCFAR